MKYQELKGLCNKCLGCEKLADYNFLGTTQCKNYIDGTKKQNLGVQEKIWK